MKKTKTICILLIVGFLAIFSISIVFSSNDNKPVAVNSTLQETPTPTITSSTTAHYATEETPNLQLVDKTTIHKNGTTYITGTIKNNGTVNYESVSVYFDLYDDDLNKVGDGMDITNGLGAGETWKFECLTTVSFTKYKLEKIQGY